MTLEESLLELLRQQQGLGGTAGLGHCLQSTQVTSPGQATLSLWRQPFRAGLSSTRDGLTPLIETSWCKCVPGEVRTAQFRAHPPPRPGAGTRSGSQGGRAQPGQGHPFPSTDLLRLSAGMVQVEQEDMVFCSHHQPGPVFIHQEGLEIHPIP